MVYTFYLKSPVFAAVARAGKPGKDAVLVSAGGGSAKTGIANMLVS
jgi:hypothetical protein